MSIFRRLKQLFLVPLSRTVPTVLLGQADQWAVPVGSLSSGSFIVSAGVGRSITFELDVVARFGADIVLLDPSPTGQATMASLGDAPHLEYLPVGLAAKSGPVEFGLPDRPDEGSFRKSANGNGASFICVSLSELAKQRARTRIDLLKIDVEGFEYEIIQSILDEGLDVAQICVEIHHNRVISIDQTVFDAALLILKLFRRGYRIVYNKNMDFTFVRSDVMAHGTNMHAAIVPDRSRSGSRDGTGKEASR